MLPMLLLVVLGIAESGLVFQECQSRHERGARRRSHGGVAWIQHAGEGRRHPTRAQCVDAG